MPDVQGGVLEVTFANGDVVHVAVDYEDVSHERMTTRQREALAWLYRVGKATPTTLKRHGFQRRTLDSLANRGLIEREYVRNVPSSFPVYRPRIARATGM